MTPSEDIGAKQRGAGVGVGVGAGAMKRGGGRRGKRSDRRDGQFTKSDCEGMVDEIASRWEFINNDGGGRAGVNLCAGNVWSVHGAEQEQ